ncbi:MAG: hypothetical protein GX811_09605 [Lentisphaerae bacterium]|nr:hypothetical protein [Lentisphaerota bacterium]
MGRNGTVHQFYHEGGQSATAGTFTRRIGSTVYRVDLYFSRTSEETINDKMLRLVPNEVANQ